MIGDYVMRNLLNMSADKTFIGCAAVYDDGEFRYDIPTEIGINEAMISMTTGDIYILADHSKILRRGVHENSYGSCTYDRQVTLITDDAVSTAVVERLRRTGMEVIMVPV
jgi:DeoR/GlpR family transcriptional regulator of sugar metabolism